ncbi:hypothetical protein M9H77_22840 [Catharanthus roseus]|uniref:Uncharacterized protein n=1 Tax=Catharanthus roseus TaxID=4058 RepID=A0ACC0ASU6_CATRO|nr:hypothetical protein M9H77_22840 [Catharanthus roseus]
MIGSTDRVRNLKRGRRNKFRHPVVNNIPNSKAQCTNVTSPGISTRPSCATLAGGPLLTQPSKMEYRLGPNPPMALRPLSTGSRSRVTLPSIHAQCKSSRHVDKKCIPSPFVPD